MAKHKKRPTSPPEPAPAPVEAETPAEAPAPEACAPVAPASRIPPPSSADFAPHKHPLHPDGPDLDPMLGERTPAFVEYLATLKAPASKA